MHQLVPLSIEKCISGKTLSKINSNYNKDVHLSALLKLDEIIKNSVLVEIHADVNKDKSKTERKEEFGVNYNQLIFRAYGLINIDDELYRVKSTLKNSFLVSDENIAYCLEVIEMDVIKENGEKNKKTEQKEIYSARLKSDTEHPSITNTKPSDTILVQSQAKLHKESEIPTNSQKKYIVTY